MARFGFECARTERYDTDVPLQLMEAVLLIGRDLDGDLSLLRRRPGVYRLLRSAIRGRIEHLEAKGPPGRRTSERVADLWADLACAAWWRGDWRTLADADAASRRLFQSRRFDEWRVSRRDVMHDRWLMNSPQAFTIRRADAALRAGRGVRAVQLLGRAREGLSSGGERGWPQLREALDDRLAAAALGAALERGGWIDVALPTDGVEAPGWRSVAGLWLRADGAAGCQFSIADEDRGARLVCMLPIGRGFEASVDLDFTSSGGSPYVIGGLVFDHPGGRDEPFYGVAVYPNADRILVTLDGVVLGRDHPIGAKCTLGVIVREASLSVIIDGEMVVRDLEAPRQERGGSCFGLGSGGWWDTGEANYCSVRLRRLDGG